MRYPTMTAVRVVVEVAHHGSVSAAADALNLTQSAVSKQLKSVEILFGVPLFKRARHTFVLTDAGTIFVEHARTAISAIETGSLKISRLTTSPNILRIKILPILGDRWLMDRLRIFADLYPDIDIKMLTFSSKDALADVDVAFRFGDGKWPNLTSEYFIGRDVVLVGAKSLFDRVGQIAAIDDIINFKLLFNPETPLLWDVFAAHNGCKLHLENKILSLGYYSLVIRGAISGQGLALIPRCLIGNELKSGQLINPLGLCYDSDICYWLTTPENRPQSKIAEIFCDWIRQEAAMIDNPSLSNADL